MAMTSTAAIAPAGGRQPLLFTLLALLVAASWTALWLWSASPYARYLGQGGWGADGALAALCSAIPQGGVLVPALLHASAWVLMIAAMMLPTAFPLLAMFRRITGARADAGRLAALVVGGFFVAWFAFGVIAHAADEALRWAVSRDAWSVANGWMVGAAVLAGAGVFQWSALKYRCLDQCRTPFTFVGARWHGRNPARDALRIGFDHGIFCVGCCWALMLVMFVVGMGSLGWMLALAVVMAAEKNLPWGRHLRTPLGIALIGWALAIVIANA
jgi:predicted metal-binding membrane protein